jgi:hypothetical protein
MTTPAVQQAVKKSDRPARWKDSQQVFWSAPGQLLPIRRIPVSLHLDPEDGAADVAKIGRRQFDGSRADVFYRQLFREAVISSCSKAVAGRKIDARQERTCDTFCRTYSWEATNDLWF